MSRIGNKIITVPEGVTVEIADDNTVTVTGSKGTLVKQFSPAISFKQEGNEITVVRSSEEKHVKQLHGIPENEVDEFRAIYDAYAGLNGNHGRERKYNYVMTSLPVIQVETKIMDNEENK